MQTTLQDRIKVELLELSKSINGIVDNYRKLKNPLIESKQDVPKATQQLDKISEQTEAATQQMLDMVEKITQREEETIRGLEDVKSQIQPGTGLADLVETLIEKANTNCNDAYTIMDALQFQDITSQQLNHAVTLLEELEVKLNQILSAINGGHENNLTDEAEAPKKQRAFDPHADLFDKKTQQEDIDNMFANK